MTLHHFSSEKDFIAESVKKIEKICRSKKGLVHIALSGGSTPRPIYAALAKSKKIDWKRINLYLVDERYVPLTDPDSNFRMVFETMMKKLGGKLHGFSFFDTTLPVKKSLEDYRLKLEPVLKCGFDLIILGIGPDGHIASLFPGSKALTTKTPVAHTTTKQFTVKNRLTITFPVILKSKHLLVLLKGSEKADTLDTWLHAKKSIANFPSKKLLSQKKKITIHFCSP